MKKHILVSIISLFIFINISFAGKVDIQSAKQVALNFYFEKMNRHVYTISFDEITIENIYTQNHKGNDVFYAFDMNTGGFVIISADDAYSPIIGYSYKGHYPKPEEKNYNFNSFMKSYAEMIDYAILNKVSATETDQQLWEYYLDINFTYTTYSNREGDVSPLLTALWNQNYPYNFYSPEDEDGPGDHAYAGCVATAMSMVMYYYRYPIQGEGSHSYYHNKYGTLSANFGETEYKYEEMNDNIQNYNPFQIALLQHHCAIAMEMNFAPDGSSAYSSWAPNCLQNYFGYNDAIYREKSDYSLTAWYNMIKEHLYENKIIYYQGSSEDGGHAFILDGFQEKYDYHFNFGWSGSGNGYYRLSDVNGFSGSQAAIFDFVPSDPAYPYLADGHKVLTQTSGSITDGSGPLFNYVSGINASWLIDPQYHGDSIENISFFFTEIDLADTDVVTIYDGENEEATVLGIFSGNEIPETITSTGNKLYVTFSSDLTIHASGFKAEYTSKFHKFCSNLVSLTEPTDTISDGSGDFNYQSGATCMWNTNFENGETITLHFLEFDTEEGKDKIKVFEGNSIIAEFSGSEIPDPVTVNGGLMFITFTSNSCVNYSGWKAYYTTDFVGVDEINENSITIAPNPSNGDFTLNLNLSNYYDYNRIDIYSIDGKKVYSKEIILNKVNNLVTVEMAKAKKGIYYLKILGEKNANTKKIIIN